MFDQGQLWQETAYWGCQVSVPQRTELPSSVRAKLWFSTHRGIWVRLNRRDTNRTGRGPKDPKQKRSSLRGLSARMLLTGLTAGDPSIWTQPLASCPAEGRCVAARTGRTGVPAARPHRGAWMPCRFAVGPRRPHQGMQRPTVCAGILRWQLRRRAHGAHRRARSSLPRRTHARLPREPSTQPGQPSWTEGPGPAGSPRDRTRTPGVCRPQDRTLNVIAR